MVHEIVRDGAELHTAPLAEELLMWISERMPRHAVRVLASARAKYETAPLSAA
jgi:hypothetical protein